MKKIIYVIIFVLITIAGYYLFTNKSGVSSNNTNDIKNFVPPPLPE